MAFEALASQPLALGFVLGLSLAAPPGPILALAADRAAHRGWWPGTIVALGATTGDAILCVLMGVGVVALLAGFPVLRVALTLLGAALMVFFAFGAWRTARRPPRLGEHVESRWSGLWGGYATGLVLALTSPFNFGWWLGAGTTLFRDYGAVVFVGFFAALVSFSLTFTALVVWMGSRVRGVVKAISYASAVLLALFALLLAYSGVTAALELA